MLLTKFYKDVFAAIFIWSPTARLDKGWDVVFEEMVKLGQEPEATSGDKQCVFTTFDAADFNRITREHTKLVEKLKDQKQKPEGSQEIPNILFYVTISQTRLMWLGGVDLWPASFAYVTNLFPAGFLVKNGSC